MSPTLPPSETPTESALPFLRGCQAPLLEELAAFAVEEPS